MRRLAFSLILLVWPLWIFSQELPSLELTLKLARERAYRSAQVDWPHVEAEARAVAPSKGEDAAVRFVLMSLGDGHSFYRPPPKASPAGLVGIPSADVQPKVLSVSKDAVEGVPVIRVNRWSGSQSEAMTATTALRLQLTDALSKTTCGLVIDFSTNSGGNMWPMLVGLSPLLTEGVLGYFEDARGVARAIEKRSGDILVNGSAQPLNGATTMLPRNSAHRVAIIVGPRSSSSGEIVPIMFHGQSNVLLFGRPTSGQSTANSSFSLPNGGFANITTAITLDRNRIRFDGKVVPQVTSDQPIADAAHWIASECPRK